MTDSTNAPKPDASPSEPTPADSASSLDREPLERPDLLQATRLSVLSFLGLASNALPLPVVPGVFEKRLRGAIIHDTASRHGLSVTNEAREILSSPGSSTAQAAKFLSGAAGFVAAKLVPRVGPLMLLAPARAGVELYATGILFERYLARHRRGPSVRIDDTEARRVREAIDRAVVRSLSPTLEPSKLLEGKRPAEDLRDETTRLVDVVLLAGASVPGYLIRRLEGAFDAVLLEKPELLGG